MTKIRVATLGLAATVVALALAVPALAHHSRAASTITVSAGKPTPFSFVLSEIGRASCRERV